MPAGPRLQLPDRIRYYWPDSRVDDCYARLLANLAAEPIPLPLLSQHLPLQYRKVRQGSISANPHDLILDQVQEVLRQYAAACCTAPRQPLPADPGCIRSCRDDPGYPEETLRSANGLATAHEIRQQPATWRETLTMVEECRATIERFLPPLSRGNLR